MKRIRLLSDVECEALHAAWKDGPNDRVRQAAGAGDVLGASGLCADRAIFLV